MSAPELPLESFLPYRLNRIAAAVSRQFKAIYGAELGLTIPEWRVLATVAQFGSITAKQISRHSDMHKTKVSRAVAGLERRRWLKRAAKPEDRREELLMLTPPGRKKYDILVPRMLELERELLERLRTDRSDIDILLTKLERLFATDNHPKKGDRGVERLMRRRLRHG